MFAAVHHPLSTSNYKAVTTHHQRDVSESQPRHHALEHHHHIPLPRVVLFCRDEISEAVLRKGSGVRGTGGGGVARRSKAKLIIGSKKYQ